MAKPTRSRKAGMEPGSLVYIGEQKTEKIKITFIDYDEAKIEEKELQNIEEAFPSKTTPTVSWTNINGLHDVSIIEKVGKHFDLHPLLLEDVVNTQQRPKVEDYGDYLFFVLKMLSYDDKSGIVKAKQVCVVLGKTYVISFQENGGDVFDVVRDRIRSGKARIRRHGADFLAYSLIDAIVDNYFGILEKLGEDIEELEDDLAKNPQQSSLKKLFMLKREVTTLRKAIFPLREVIGRVEKGDSPLIKKGTTVYLRDVYDHAVSMIDNIDTFRDMMSEMVDIYLSAQSNKLNEVMKVLTIISTIFIPMTFIASIYGMNFNYLPELQWRHGYFIVLGAMAIISVVMLFFFKRKKWI
ncbi:MAG TPA: magnesium/cobalt transporter CorA [Candidatus Nanoarchaeia archaeon]|nr:magnesium/cobalt transporter CorA [Candidatus Nanoarchaeia archaeon]